METTSTAARTAAFYDVEGTLVKTNVVHSYAYYAVNTARIGERLKRFGTLLAEIPAYWVMDKLNRRLFNERIYSRYEGMTEDRLVVIGEEFVEKVLLANLYDGATDLLARSREAGHLQIFISGALDYVIEPLARHFEVDHWVANRLEIVDGKATGHLLPPVIAGPKKARWILSYAESEGIDLSASFAYADSSSDVPMLSVVGNGCAVNPDFRLRQTARSHDWPILNL